MVGYARTYDFHSSYQTSVQKYNCHKLFEYRVGLPIALPLNSEETLSSLAAFIDEPVENSSSDVFMRHVDAF